MAWAQGIGEEFGSSVGRLCEQGGIGLTHIRMHTIPAFWDSRSILESGAQVDDEHNTRDLAVNKIVSSTYDRNEMERHVSWANGKSLFNHMHRQAF